MTALIFAAPASGAGLSTVTLALLRHLTLTGHDIRGAKSGPDHVDPRLHEVACGRICHNLDAWAMSPERIRELASGPELLLIEGAAGLFDGAPDGRGAVADLARMLRLPVVLIVDAGRMAQSVAPLCTGFAKHDPNVRIEGVILNNVGSPPHEAMLRGALKAAGLTVLGALPRHSGIAMPRRTGPLQADERADLEAVLNRAAEWVAEGTDIDGLLALAAPHATRRSDTRLTPPAQRIAVARDAAFVQTYPHILADWRRAGAEIVHFSPLANEKVPDAGFIYLPGGPVQDHAGRMAENGIFVKSLHRAAESVPVHGEGGGYMALGRSLTDATGATHRMADLLDLDVSFATPRLHLGYRHLTDLGGPFGGHLTAHEHHAATTLRAEGDPLYAAHDATGAALPPMGLRKGHVSGSFANVIDRAAP
ncbi:cobyrinic acid a,c-diamide synthase [Oceanicola sp. 22II-s10i]|uniref:cobyrinate a,c-diamide synthase n=1 Tax=Oceanicola sp. 22II-s10i TaxID=1317116 RepID=UPI000B52706F|nr:cobyrinate a,c-diamide synthase [Oceanicola sp. 22II-s10i]OWU83909.1 cobyrinic acid a,c-diamide synthase [Oceanicola sp. 22II-s10i]